VTKSKKLFSWSLMSLFNTNMAISETKGQGWRVILTQWRKASDASTYNKGRQLSHHKTKLNQILHKQECILN